MNTYKRLLVLLLVPALIFAGTPFTVRAEGANNATAPYIPTVCETTGTIDKMQETDVQTLTFADVSANEGTTEVTVEAIKPTTEITKKIIRLPEKFGIKPDNNYTSDFFKNLFTDFGVVGVVTQTDKVDCFEADADYYFIATDGVDMTVNSETERTLWYHDTNSINTIHGTSVPKESPATGYTYNYVVTESKGWVALNIVHYGFYNVAVPNDIVTTLPGKQLAYKVVDAYQFEEVLYFGVDDDQIYFDSELTIPFDRHDYVDRKVNGEVYMYTYQLNETVSNDTGYTFDFGTYKLQDITATRKKADGTGSAENKPLIASDVTGVTMSVHAMTAPSSFTRIDTFKNNKDMLWLQAGVQTTTDTATYNITEVSVPARINVPFPAGVTATTPAYAYNYHNGLDAVPEQVSLAVNTTNNGWVLSTNKFSPFVILYGDAIKDINSVTVQIDDGGSVDTRPTSINLNWMAKYSDGSQLTGTETIAKATYGLASTNAVQANIQVLKNYAGGTRTEFTVECVPVGSTDYTVTKVDATTFKLSYTKPTVPYTFKVVFDDADNKCGVRPSSVKVKVVDTSDNTKYVEGTVTITNPTTTTTNTYTGSVDIPTGKTYAVSAVNGLDSVSASLYTITTSGDTATLKYVPQTEQKTYGVVWDDSTDSSHRPTSVNITVKDKNGNTYNTLLVNADTNWKATVTLYKYYKGIEQTYTIEGQAISNYSCTVSGDTITYKFTGTSTPGSGSGSGSGTGTEATPEPTYDFESFDWIDYANAYPDLIKAFGYNKEKLYAHYIHYGLKEGRTATFTGKYSTVDEDILKAYYPSDYKYKVKDGGIGSVSGSDATTIINGDGTTTTVNPTTKTPTTTREKVGTAEIVAADDGYIHMRQYYSDGSYEESIYDEDNNLISTKTYYTGEDMKMLYLLIAAMLLTMVAITVLTIKVGKSKKVQKILDSLISV